MRSNLRKVMEGNGRSESSEGAWRTSENVEWVLFGSSCNTAFYLLLITCYSSMVYLYLYSSVDLVIFLASLY